MLNDEPLNRVVASQEVFTHDFLESSREFKRVCGQFLSASRLFHFRAFRLCHAVIEALCVYKPFAQDGDA